MRMVLRSAAPSSHRVHRVIDEHPEHVPTGREHNGATKEGTFHHAGSQSHRAASHRLCRWSLHAGRIIEEDASVERVADMNVECASHRHPQSAATNDLLLTYHAAALDVDAPRPIFCRQAFRAPPVRGED
jgi:hypothetical protein